MKYQEIADLTGYSLSKVKVDAHRGVFDPKDEESISAYIGADGAESSMEPLAPVVAIETPEPTHDTSEPEEGSKEHILSLGVGATYRGFANILVEVHEDAMGNLYMKMFPRAQGPWVKDKE